MAKEMTLGLKYPNDILHFCASNRSGLCSSCNRVEKSLGSTRNFWFAGGSNAGVHNSDSRATARSAEEVISERHEVSKYLMRNKLTRDDRTCC